MRQVGAHGARTMCSRGGRRKKEEEEEDEEGTDDARVRATIEKRRKVMNDRAISCGAGGSLTL